jgi:plasmid stabilization system protein ParE
MRLEFNDEALDELEEARGFYNAISKKLALRFLEEVERGLNGIRENPNLWPPYTRSTRRYLLKSFPIYLVFRVRSRHVIIVAVAHAKRKPGYWQKRLRDRAKQRDGDEW